MATVSLRCINCNQYYVLGKNAKVVSSLGFLDEIKGIDILSGASPGFMNTPDLIDLCVWAALSAEDKRKQEKIIRMIKRGQRIQWTCKKCNAMNNY